MMTFDSLDQNHAQPVMTSYAQQSKNDEFTEIEFNKEKIYLETSKLLFLELQYNFTQINSFQDDVREGKFATFSC